MENSYLSLKQNVVLRKDKNRAIAYFKTGGGNERFSPKQEDNLSENDVNFYVLSPTFAMALFLMDGTMTYSSICDAVSDYFKMVKTDKDLFRKSLMELSVFFTLSNVAENKRIKELSIADILPNLQLIDYYDMSAEFLYIPYTYLILPTMSCYVDCCYCYANREHAFDPIPIEKWISLIEDLATKYGAKDISVSGGDIFLYEHWKTLLNTLANNSYFPELPTKVPLSISDQKLLYDMGFRSYQISLDTLEPNLISSNLNIRDPMKYRNEILRSITTASEIGLKISINCILTNETLDDVVNTMEIIRSYKNIYRVSIGTMGYTLYNRDVNSSLMLTRKDETRVKVCYNRVSELFKDSGVYFKMDDPIYIDADKSVTEDEFWNRAFCTGGRTGLVILPDGKITCCEELYWHPEYILGDLKEQSLDEVFASPKRWNLLNPRKEDVDSNSPCFNCIDEVFEKCNREKGRCYRETLKIFGKVDYPDPRCPFYKDIQSFSQTNNEFPLRPNC